MVSKDTNLKNMDESWEIRRKKSVWESLNWKNPWIADVFIKHTSRKTKMKYGLVCCYDFIISLVMKSTILVETSWWLGFGSSWMCLPLRSKASHTTIRWFFRDSLIVIDKLTVLAHSKDSTAVLVGRRCLFDVSTVDFFRTRN